MSTSDLMSLVKVEADRFEDAMIERCTEETPKCTVYVYELEIWFLKRNFMLMELFSVLCNLSSNCIPSIWRQSQGGQKLLPMMSMHQ